MKFPLGFISYSERVQDLMSRDIFFSKFVVDSVILFCQGNWGHDYQMNNEVALKRNGKLYAIYKQNNLPDITVITEADKSGTVVRFPDESYERLIKY